MAKKKLKNTDRRLLPEEAEQIRLSVLEGYKLLKLKPENANTKKIQEAICKAIDAVCSGKKPASQETMEDIGVYLGCLWGQTVCDRMGWEWCYLSAQDHENFAIVPKDRSLVIEPLTFILQQVHKQPPEENTSLLLFNMIVAGKTPRAKAGDYFMIG